MVRDRLRCPVTPGARREKRRGEEAVEEEEEEEEEKTPEEPLVPLQHRVEIVCVRGWGWGGGKAQ